MTKYAEKVRLTPGRAMRRPKARAILVFLANREETPKEIMRAIKCSKGYAHTLLREMNKTGLVEKITEGGTWPAYKTSDKTLAYMRERNVIQVQLNGRPL